MKPASRHPKLVSSMFKTLDTIFLPHIEIEETRIVAVAAALAESFVRDKKDLHAKAKNAPENAEKMLFSPLMLSARHVNGSLQITWKEVHLIKYKVGDGRWKKYVPIPKHSNGGYSIARLQKSAGYASELVEGYERDAADLRERWRQLMTLKKDIYAAIWRLPAVDAAPLQANIPAMQATTDTATIDTLVPKPAPEPILSPDKPRPARRM